MKLQRMLGMVCSTNLPARLHGCQASAISVTSLGAFRSVVTRPVWSKKLSVTTLALIGLSDRAWGSGPAISEIWSRFRQMCQYLAHKLKEEGRIHRLLNYVSTGSPGHGWTHAGLPSCA